jgi:hypothetical protein
MRVVLVSGVDCAWLNPCSKIDPSKKKELTDFVTALTHSAVAVAPKIAQKLKWLNGWGLTTV